MLTDVYYAIGVMSGTSLDGVDLAYVKLTKNTSWNYTILIAETVPYSLTWKQALKDGISLDSEALQNLDKQYTSYLAETIQTFIDKNKLDNIAVICSHGHTIKHQPDKGYTLQIGNLSNLASLLNHTIVCNFRVQDVALGGQGAPLVPLGDRLLFNTYDYCLNLGGFANISTETNGNRMAYDICPVNTVLNFYAGKLGFEYDESGDIARTASVNTLLLQKLNALEFYKLYAPKSLGYEWVKDIILPLIEAHDISAQEKIATFTEHCAQQISACVDDGKSVLVTGGGAFNSYLIERISALKNTNLIIPDAKTVNFKEALVFALLGVLKLRSETNVLASVTGASHDHSSGKILQP